MKINVCVLTMIALLILSACSNEKNVGNDLADKTVEEVACDEGNETETSGAGAEAIETQPTELQYELTETQVDMEEVQTQSESTVTETEKIVDTEAPVITGVHKIEVFTGDGISYKKGINVTDNIDEEVTLVVDSSKVNTNAAGDYPIYYSATDAAGNRAIEETVIHIEQRILDEAYVQPMIDGIIAEVTTPEMSTWDKMYVLWEWCKTTIKYSSTKGDRSSLWAGAYEGIHNRKGDCFVYYATYTLFLNRLGVENMCVSRVAEDSNHWWNLVYWNGKWYHSDSSPRKLEHNYECFMQTDAQLQEYNNFFVEKPNYYHFDTTLYPERGVEIIYDGWAKGRMEGN